MSAAKSANHGVFIVNELGGRRDSTELRELEGESGKGCVVFDGVCVLAFAEAGLDVGRKVAEELLGEGAGPRGDGRRGR